MGTPAPTKNLTLPTPKPTATTSVGVVVEVNPTGTRAIVNVAGSTFQAAIPGSVLSVAVDKSVTIRTEGNARTITGVVTPLVKPAYDVTGVDEFRGDTDAPPTISNPSTGGFGPVTIGTWSPSATDPGTLADINKVLTRYANINSNFALAAASDSGIIDDLQSLRDEVAALREVVDQIRNQTGTVINDLQNDTGILGVE